MPAIRRGVIVRANKEHIQEIEMQLNQFIKASVSLAGGRASDFGRTSTSGVDWAFGRHEDGRCMCGY